MAHPSGMVTVTLRRREHQGNRGRQRIWEQDIGTEHGSIDHVPSLDLLGVHSALSSSDESIDEVGTLLIQSGLNGSSTGKWAFSTRACGNVSYPQHVKDFLLSPPVSKESVSAPFKAATPLSHWLSCSS